MVVPMKRSHTEQNAHTVTLYPMKRSLIVIGHVAPAANDFIIVTNQVRVIMEELELNGFTMETVIV
jgi:hypothetical protein